MVVLYDFNINDNFIKNDHPINKYFDHPILLSSSIQFNLEE
jgi:hypothetical protein